MSEISKIFSNYAVGDIVSLKGDDVLISKLTCTKSIVRNKIMNVIEVTVRNINTGKVYTAVDRKIIERKSKLHA